MQRLRSLAFAATRLLLRALTPAQQLQPYRASLSPALPPTMAGGSDRVRDRGRRGRVAKGAAATARYYAVHRGRDGFRGILPDWPSCKHVVNGVRGAVYKSFTSRPEAIAFAEHGFAAASSSVSSTAAPYVRTGVRTAAASSSFSPLTRRDPLVADPLQHLPMASASSDSAPRNASALHRGEGSNDQLLRSSAPNRGILVRSALPQGRQLVVYTDGACEGNGKHSAVAGVGVFFCDQQLAHYNVSEPLQGQTQTNQRAELTGVLRALQIAFEKALVAPSDQLLIRTDSKYASVGLTDWVHKWKKNGFMTSSKQPVKNADLWRDLDATRCALESSGVIVTFEWVKGHAGNEGNEQADQLAVAGITRQ